MYYKQIAFFILTYSLLICSSSKAQIYFDLGYGHGFGQPQDINKTTYLFNKIQSPSKDFRKIRGGNGVMLSIGLIEDGIGVELKYHGLGAKTKSNFEQFGVIKTADIKINKSIISLNFIYGGDKFRIGQGIDMGTFIIRGRTYPSYQSKKPDYGKMITENGISGRKNKTSLGLNVFTEYQMSDFLSIRGTYSWVLGSGIDGSALDYYLLGLDTYSPFGTSVKWSNFRIDLFIRFQGN